MTINRLTGWLLAALMVSAFSLAQAQVPNGVVVLTQLADSGDADAQYGLGTWYINNQGSGADLAKARDWLLQAARQQHVHAMYRLGVMLNQYDELRDEAQALDWTRSAADAGLADAQATYAMFLFQGLGGAPPNCVDAVSWLEKAGSVGHQIAQSNLVWVLATCPEERHRDGSRALRIGFDQVYRQGLDSANQLDNLAAAYAAAGDYLSAEAVQKHAMAQETDERVLAIFQSHLESYQARRPWSELSKP
ncbi:MAG: tetratricopeptide repeat protein [Lysobacterales bacterium]